MSSADNVWNRAALASGGPMPLEGDRALADVILAHGLVMNGGVDHLIEAASQAEIAAAVRGFRFLGLDEVAGLLDHVMRGARDPEEATVRYGELVSSDDVLTRRFEAVFTSRPEAFAPFEALSCPACGFLTLSGETYGSYEICAVCDWEDDGVQLANPACDGGANHRSLIEAQTRALNSFPTNVGEHKGFLRSRSWRPLSQQETERALAERGQAYWLNRAVVSRWECYWNGGFPLPKDLPTFAG